MTKDPAIAEIEVIEEQSYNAADPEKIEKAKKRRGSEKRRHLDFITVILANAEGREWYYRLLLACDVFRQPFSGIEGVTEFRCGKMDVGYKLIADAQAGSFDNFMLMIKEGKEKKLTPLFPVEGMV